MTKWFPNFLKFIDIELLKKCCGSKNIACVRGTKTFFEIQEFLKAFLCLY